MLLLDSPSFKPGMRRCAKRLHNSVKEILTCSAAPFRSRLLLLKQVALRPGLDIRVEVGKLVSIFRSLVLPYSVFVSLYFWRPRASANANQVIPSKTEMVHTCSSYPLVSGNGSAEYM